MSLRMNGVYEGNIYILNGVSMAVYECSPKTFWMALHDTVWMFSCSPFKVWYLALGTE